MTGSLSITEEILNRIINSMMNCSYKHYSKFNYYKKLRSKVMYRLQFYLCLRSKEVYKSKIIHLNILDRTYYIPASNSKEKNQRIYKIPDEVYNDLREYLVLRRRFFNNSIWLFPTISKRDNYVQLDYYEKVFRKAQRDCGVYLESYIDKSNHKRGAFTPHGLRKGGAVRLLLRGVNPIIIKVLLGHKDFRCFKTYVEYAEDIFRSRLQIRI